jgi:hypothetical protein
MEVEVEEAMIIEDLDPTHSLRCLVSRRTAEYMGLKVVQDWPPSIPDLNTIKNVWVLLNKNV